MSHVIVSKNTQTFCEDCGKNPAIYQCDICGKTLCNECGTELTDEDTDFKQLEGNYCSECYRLGEDKYFEDIQIASDEFAENVQEILEKWRNGEF